MIRICTRAIALSEQAQAWLMRYRGKKPHFACILSFTETSLQPHISAAGNSPKARRYTALADGEYLHNGRNSRYSLPTLPAGISPAILTRAILTHCDMPLQLFSTGLPDRLTVPHISLPTVLAKDLSTGSAMTLQQAEQLFSSGYEQGKRLAADCPSSHYWILGESVVGGTTTAQAVLTALGYKVTGKVSSSHLQSNHEQKRSLIQTGLRRWQERCKDSEHRLSERQFPKRQLTERQTLHSSDLRADSVNPIAAASAMGDPMQLVAAGMVLSISQSTGLLLAGGSQMLAVYALAKAIAPFKNISWNPHQVVVGTTRWVIEDISADTVAIAQAVGAPYLASQLSFARSPYFQLRAYERGFVKEGTGAGGCAIAAHLYQNCTNAQIRHAIEAQLRQQ